VTDRSRGARHIHADDHALLLRALPVAVLPMVQGFQHRTSCETRRRC
jgi:hypothetical protein